MRPYPWGLESLYTGRPTVGGLMDLCEENYHHLLRLAPELRMLEGCYLSPLAGEMDLHLEILEQTRYTTLVHLTYWFKTNQQLRPDPDAIMRIYHDSRQAEVIELAQSIVNKADPAAPLLTYKWKLQLFLSKWLNYCVQRGHLFEQLQKTETSLRIATDATASC